MSDVAASPVFFIVKPVAVYNAELTAHYLSRRAAMSKKLDSSLVVNP
jgi:hypothetical protein